MYCHINVRFVWYLQFVMAISNPLKGIRKGGTVGKPFPGIEVSQRRGSFNVVAEIM